jgi:hypothetical protein
MRRSKNFLKQALVFAAFCREHAVQCVDDGLVETSKDYEKAANYIQQLVAEVMAHEETNRLARYNKRRKKVNR